jgi:hypothetical protein
MSDPASISPALRAKVYTTFTTDIDLIAASGGGGAAARRIRAITAGVVGLYFKDDPTTLVLMEYQEGDVDDVQVSKIAKASDGTTVTKLGVYW